MSKWQENMKECPDCHRKFKTARKKGDECSNPDCESYVTEHKGKLIWWNENWG
jgi:hypothetical protein